MCVWRNVVEQWFSTRSTLLHLTVFRGTISRNRNSKCAWNFGGTREKHSTHRLRNIANEANVMHMPQLRASMPDRSWEFKMKTKEVRKNKSWFWSASQFLLSGYRKVREQSRTRHLREACWSTVFALYREGAVYIAQVWKRILEDNKWVVAKYIYCCQSY